MFSTLLRSGFVLVRQSIVLCSQKPVRVLNMTEKTFTITLVTQHGATAQG